MSDEANKLTPEIIQQWQLTRPIPAGCKLGSPRIVAAVLQNIANGGYIEASCIAAGISKVTYYNWIERASEDEHSVYAEFVELLEKARAQAELDCITIIRRAADKNWLPAAWILERTHPDKYALRNRTTLDGGLLVAPTTAAGLIAIMREAVNGETDA